MKKALLLVPIFLIAFFLTTGQTLAQQDKPTPSEAVTPTPVDYDLAFPGLLPDSPLYKLKVLRDKIEAALISDNRKKAEFFLMQADKGILASAILVDKKEFDLAATTALKAENYYTLLISELRALPRKPDDAFFKKLETASAKHQEVLQSLIKRVPSKNKPVFSQVLDFSKRNLDSVKNYKNQE